MSASKRMLLEQMESERICKNCSHWNYNEDCLDEEPGMRDTAETGICGVCKERTSSTGNCSGTKTCADDFEFC